MARSIDLVEMQLVRDEVQDARMKENKPSMHAEVCFDGFILRQRSVTG